MPPSPFPEDQPLIRIRGARTHNLRNIDVDLPAGKLIVMTGVSGSGKSSLAFDTLFAEGQRRYLESVSVQTRALLRQRPRPDVDEITGIAPTISVDQRVTSVPARSTLATITEIHDFLRLLYARGGTAHCTGCGQPVQRQSVDQILQQTLQLPERTRLMILSPMVRGRRGAHREVLERIARNGFVRARIDAEIVDISEAKPLEPGKAHTVDAIVDRIVMKEGIATRLRESIELACRESDGTCIISHESEGQWSEKLFSTRFSCPGCDLNFPTPEPRSFSFNSPWGACPECSGLGVQQVAVTNCCPSAPSAGIPEPEANRPRTPARGANSRRRSGRPTVNSATFHQEICKACDGTRLQAFPRGITFLNLTLPEFSRQSVDAALVTVDSWWEQICRRDSRTLDTPLTQESRLIAERTLPDIQARLKCLSDVGIGYLNLDRPARGLSGGEFQRARLAASLSSQLSGAHFVLDEPTSGLHPRDTQRLLKTLLELRDAGGTVIVVEHDGDIMRAADWLVDLGPGAGADGGHLLFSGTPHEAELLARSPTGDYLRKRCQEPFLRNNANTVPDTFLRICNARLHNLRNVTIDIPLHQLVCVTGVSGSGKSSLIFGTLLPILTAALSENRSVEAAAADAQCDGIDGIEQILRVLSLDQSPLGRSSRSCIATLCGLWDEVRRLFTKTREARVKGMSSKHFSFNSGNGRCPECRGTGIRNVRMNFLPDAVVPCPTCHGLRFTKAVCSVRFREKSVADILQMRVDEATEFFAEFQRLHSILAVFRSVGLGYLALGQPASTFSGGEAQRAKLASELAAPSSEHTLYVLDEPTSGLHPADVSRLINHLRQLVEAGHSVIVIEHQLDVIRSADWILDIGPDSADRGGEVVFSGRPGNIIDCARSETANALR
jgi:excinuclease ABC subunit A